MLSLFRLSVIIFALMSNGFNFFQFVSSTPEVQKSVAGLTVAALMLVLSRKAFKKLSTDDGIKESIVPESKLSLFTFWDFLVEGFVKHQDSILGKENRKYLPITGGVFFFILFSNLLGLVPGMPAITTTVWVNVAMALVVYGSFNYYGIKEQGLFKYIGHFFGPVIYMAPIVFIIEIFSVHLRIVTLNLRLYWNITADHIVLGVFTDLTKVIIPVIFYGFGTFVAFMQAFVFSTLTMVYILLSTEHEDDGHSEVGAH